MWPCLHTSTKETQASDTTKPGVLGLTPFPALGHLECKAGRTDYMASEGLSTYASVRLMAKSQELTQLEVFI